MFPDGVIGINGDIKPQTEELQYFILLFHGSCRLPHVQKCGTIAMSAVSVMSQTELSPVIYSILEAVPMATEGLDRPLFYVRT